MRSNKGISMLTLVITIICIIIFIGIAYRVGTRYISESRQEERTVLVSVLSAAVERRQNDKYVGLPGDGELVYAGYHVQSGDFRELAKNFEKTSYMYEPGFWFVIDADSAENLGIIDTDKYLVKDLLDKPEDQPNKYVAVVDYYRAQVELVKYKDIKITVDEAVGGREEHICTPTVATCIFPSVCTGCGKIVAEAPGHRYDPDRIICTEDKVCLQCGYIAELAIGHEYDTSVLSYDDSGHFHKCIRYSSCNGVGSFENHSLQYAQTPSQDEWKHVVDCTVCDWSKSAEDCELVIRPKDVYYHMQYCVKCLKEKELEHDAIKKYKYIDKREHLLYCETCNSDLYKEEHIDVETPYGICDKCDGIIDIDQPPRVTRLTMENITEGVDSSYWAKRGEKIQVTLEVSMLLGGTPEIILQNSEIEQADITQKDDLTWIAEIDTADYGFNQGLMNIEVRNIRSLWGVEAENMYATTDDRYITYDSIKPVYEYIEK